jgi:hypothetical protein
MIWQNSSAKGANAQGCQLENHQQDLALKKMNKKRLLCTTQWVGLPQDIVSMYLLSEWQWQLQSQHWQQCISTPTASDLLKPTSFEPGRIIHTEHEHENELQLPQASVTAIRSLPLRSSRWSKIVTSFSSVSSSLVVDIAMLMIVLSEAATLSPAAAVPQGLLSTGADQFLSTIVASGFFPPHLGLPQSFARSAACGE